MGVLCFFASSSRAVHNNCVAYHHHRFSSSSLAGVGSRELKLWMLFNLLFWDATAWSTYDEIHALDEANASSHCQNP